MRRYYRKKEYKQVDLIERAIIADKRVRELRINITKSEERILILLKKLKYSFVFQYPLFDEWFFLIADFYLQEKRIMIEIDGFSHQNIISKRKESKRRKWLRKQGIEVLRIKNEATIKMTTKELERRIKRTLLRRK